MTKIKKIAIISGIIIVIAAGSYLGINIYQRYFKKPVIDDNAVIVEAVKEISQLLTFSYYDECVEEYQRERDDKPCYVIIGRGTVYAGFDLSEFYKTEDSINIEGNTVTVILNPPKIIDVVILPSGFSTFVQKRRISHERRILTQNKARMKLREQALQKGILKNSKEQGENLLTSLLETIGFDKVTIKYKDRKTGKLPEQKS